MIAFRKAGTSDVPALIDLRLQMLNEEGEKPVNIQAELMEFYMRRIRDHLLIQYLAEDDGKPIGTAAAAFYDLPPSYLHRTGVIGLITNVYTLPSYRDRSIGSHLLDLVIKECKALGFKTLWTPDSDRVGTLFDEFGFVPSGQVLHLGLREWKAPDYPPVVQDPSSAVPEH